MARCERCGKDGCAEGDLCHACKTQLSYHFVTVMEKKKPDRSLRGRMRAWWWPINPEDRRRHNIIALAAAGGCLLLIAVLIIVLAASRGRAGEDRDAMRGGAGVVSEERGWVNESI